METIDQSVIPWRFASRRIEVQSEPFFVKAGKGSIAFAGGLNMTADPRYLKVFRQDADGRIVKGQTASRLRKKFGWLKKVYWKENVVWSPGYFV